MYRNWSFFQEEKPKKIQFLLQLAFRKIKDIQKGKLSQYTNEVKIFVYFSIKLVSSWCFIQEGVFSWDLSNAISHISHSFNFLILLYLKFLLAGRKAREETRAKASSPFHRFYHQFNSLIIICSLWALSGYNNLLGYIRPA